MAEILDCKLVATSIKTDCRKQAEGLKKLGIIPKLAIVRVGEKGPDLSYEKGATKTMAEAGIEVEVFAMPENVTQEEYVKKFREINADPSIHGILAFRPLDNIDENVAISQNLNPLKDVDASTTENMGKILLNDPTALYPCTAEAIMSVLDFYKINLKGKNVAIINRSNVIGKPLSMMLVNRSATVTVCNSSTKNIKDICLSSDIVIGAIPYENTIKADQIRKGAIVIDASIIRKDAFDENGKPILNERTGIQKKITVGCCEKDVENVAGFKTPVPGIGAITSAILAKNLIKACKIQNK